METRRGQGRRSRFARSGADQGCQAPPKPEVKPEPVKEKEKPTWLLKVFEGDKLREEQVELPDEPDADSAKGGEKAGSGWMEFFQRALQTQQSVVRQPRKKRINTGVTGTAGDDAGRAVAVFVTRIQPPLEVQGCSCSPSRARSSFGICSRSRRRRIRATGRRQQDETAPLPVDNDPLIRVTEPQSDLRLVEKFAKIIELKNRISTVYGFDPEVVHVTKVDMHPNEIRIHALAPGVTSLVLVDEKNTSFTVEVFVIGDVRHLQAYLKNLFPTTR